MKKKMIGTLLLSLVFSATANAAPPVSVDLEKERILHQQVMEQVEKELEDTNRDYHVFERLTDSEWNRVAEKTIGFAEEYPDLSKEELNEKVYEEYVAETQKDIIRIQYIGGMNSQEAKVCALNPIDCTKVKKAAETAKAEAERRYVSSALHNGNGDAFRHMYWNKLMTNAIGASEAKKFADAHEFGASGQPKNEETMDLHNNSLGRSNAKYTAAEIVKYLVDSGSGRRLNSSGQLISTNSSGKR
ncbi:hypothetical protein GJU40_13330 [Bacillus lacus]|uniref:DUF6973 domain-containing protein n=1 Tax=Metabacillus lacus TaxID=1983721 RepID=A0A7X2J0E0_9BACI|nr:hypothetical protein [Metabacillus lacus]MRX73125.1 hypothetical protein [Metabacillus lacus]